MSCLGIADESRPNPLPEQATGDEADDCGTERVQVEISVAESVVDLSMIGVQIDCAQEIVNAVTAALLNTVQRERRDQERERTRH